MKKGSQFTRFFSHKMKRIDVTGNLDILKKRYSGQKACKTQVNEKPLGYEKLTFLFLMLISGWIMSILVVFFEYMIQTKKNKQELTNEDKEKWIM